MIKNLFLNTVMATAFFGATTGAFAATLNDAKVSVTQFFEAVLRNDGAAYSKLAPQAYLMAAPDFGVPMSLDQAHQALEHCRLQQIDSVKSVEKIPGMFEVLVTLACSTEHIAPTMGLYTDGLHILAIYPGGFPPPRPHQ